MQTVKLAVRNKRASTTLGMINIASQIAAVLSQQAYDTADRHFLCGPSKCSRSNHHTQDFDIE